MSASEPSFASLWDRFYELAAMSDAERQLAYHSDGMEFLSSLMAETLRDYGDPELDSAEKFSEFVVELRENYRQWNQALMTAMVRFDDSSDQSGREALAVFATSCHWKHLAEVAQHYIDSKPDI